MSLITQLRYLPYRVIRRIGTADISYVFGVELAQIRPTLLPIEFEFVELTVERLKELIDLHPQLFATSRPKDLEDGRAYCYAISFQGALAAFAWVAIGDIPAGFNHNGDLQAGLPITMPVNSGFVHNVFVMSQFRGRRLYGALMSGLKQSLFAHGVTRLVLTTDATNQSALVAVRRMGFQYLGCAWLFKCGRFSFASYPRSPVFDTVYLGRYTGDRRSSHT